MKELLQYSEHDAFRDAVNEDGDVVPISDLSQPEIDDLAVQRGRDFGVRPKVASKALRAPQVDRSSTLLDVSVYHGPQYGEEEGVGYPNGQPHYYEPLRRLTEEQQRRHARGMAMVRRVLDETVKKHS